MPFVSSGNSSSDTNIVNIHDVLGHRLRLYSVCKPDIVTVLDARFGVVVPACATAPVISPEGIQRSIGIMPWSAVITRASG
jgi:hypothetical protein